MPIDSFANFHEFRVYRGARSCQDDQGSRENFWTDAVPAATVIGMVRSLIPTAGRFVKGTAVSFTLIPVSSNLMQSSANDEWFPLPGAIHAEIRCNRFPMKKMNPAIANEIIQHRVF